MDEVAQGGVDGVGVGEDAGDVAIEDDGGGAVGPGAAGEGSLAGGEARDGELFVGAGEGEGGAEEVVEALTVGVGLGAGEEAVAEGGGLAGEPVFDVAIKVGSGAVEGALVGVGDGAVGAAAALSDEARGFRAQVRDGQGAALVAQALDVGQDRQKVFNPLVRWHGIIIRFR